MLLELSTSNVSRASEISTAVDVPPTRARLHRQLDLINETNALTFPLPSN
jgi:hypothetical protein